MPNHEQEIGYTCVLTVFGIKLYEGSDLSGSIILIIRTAVPEHQICPIGSQSPIGSTFSGVADCIGCPAGLSSAGIPFAMRIAQEGFARRVLETAQPQGSVGAIEICRCSHLVAAMRFVKRNQPIQLFWPNCSVRRHAWSFPWLAYMRTHDLHAKGLPFFYPK